MNIFMEWGLNMIELPIQCGVYINGTRYYKLTMSPLSPEQKQVIENSVAAQVKTIIDSGAATPISDHHTKAVESLFHLREFAVASITSIGDCIGPFTWEQVSMMSAHDWWCVVEASMGIDELVNGAGPETTH